MFWKVQTNPFFVGWNKKYKSLILRDIFCPKVGLFFSFVEKSLKNLSKKSMKIFFSTVFFTLLRAEPLICQENFTPSWLMQYYVRINSASKKNPNHIIEVYPVLLPVAHIVIQFQSYQDYACNWIYYIGRPSQSLDKWRLGPGNW